MQLLLKSHNLIRGREKNQKSHDFKLILTSNISQIFVTVIVVSNISYLMAMLYQFCRFLSLVLSLFSNQRLQVEISLKLFIVYVRQCEMAIKFLLLKHLFGQNSQFLKRIRHLFDNFLFCFFFNYPEQKSNLTKEIQIVSLLVLLY